MDVHNCFKSDSRYSFGVIPVFYLNLAEKWLCDEKARYSLISETDLLV